MNRHLSYSVEIVVELDFELNQCPPHFKTVFSPLKEIREELILLAK